MKAILFVALGGGLGSVIRYLVSRLFDTNFPYATLIVNVLGCLIIGYVSAYYSQRGIHINEEVRLFLTVGFCGGLTTFSTFMNECSKMITYEDYMQVALYMCLSIILGLSCVYLGQKLFCL